ncbi:hypothetical protein [Halomonas sp. H10-9-1]|uniref:hypothetical protein n=1 Tax=Halomonas sp. H10-9-1 TaxID=2950871 RepID=UPI0032DF7C7B
MEDVKFPDGCPDGCPPSDAEDANGQVYRVCRANPPVAKDFASHVELGKVRGGDECMRCGLSVFRNEADARQLTKLFPKLGKWVFSGRLTPEAGKIKPTPARQRPSHTTWWPYAGVDRAAAFQPVDEE